MAKRIMATLTLSLFFLSAAYFSMSDAREIRAWDTSAETQGISSNEETVLEQEHEEIQNREKNIENVTEWKNFEARMEQIRIDTEPEKE